MRVTGFPAPFSTWEKTSFYPFEYRINEENILEEKRKLELINTLELKYCKTLVYSLLDSSGILRSSFCNHVRKMIQLQKMHMNWNSRSGTKICKSAPNVSKNFKKIILKRIRKRIAFKTSIYMYIPQQSISWNLPWPQNHGKLLQYLSDWRWGSEE